MFLLIVTMHSIELGLVVGEVEWAAVVVAAAVAVGRQAIAGLRYMLDCLQVVKHFHSFEE